MFSFSRKINPLCRIGSLHHELCGLLVAGAVVRHQVVEGLRVGRVIDMPLSQFEPGELVVPRVVIFPLEIVCGGPHGQGSVMVQQDSIPEVQILSQISLSLDSEEEIFELQF